MLTSCERHVRSLKKCLLCSDDPVGKASTMGYCYENTPIFSLILMFSSSIFSFNSPFPPAIIYCRNSVPLCELHGLSHLTNYEEKRKENAFIRSLNKGATHVNLRWILRGFVYI